MTERYHLQILDVQPKGVKVHGPLTQTLAIECITRILREQPLGMVHENPRIWVVDLDNGNITKPILKLSI